MTGMVGWSPETFWKSTPYESSCAYIGNCRAQGAGYFAKSPSGWSQSDVDDFKGDIEEAKRRFPDKPA